MQLSRSIHLTRCASSNGHQGIFLLVETRTVHLALLKKITRDRKNKAIFLHQNESFYHPGKPSFHGLHIAMEPCSARFVKRSQIFSDSSSVFVSGGCANFRLESLRSHAGSFGHKRAADAIRIAANPQEASMPRALRQLNKEVASKLEKLFDIAYFVAKMEIPFTTYPHLFQVEVKHDVELGQTYRNDKACKYILIAISEQFKEGTGQQLQTARFLSVMSDSPK